MRPSQHQELQMLYVPYASWQTAQYAFLEDLNNLVTSVILILEKHRNILKTKAISWFKLSELVIFFTLPEAALFLCIILEYSGFAETEEVVDFGDTREGVGGFESLEKNIFSL